MKTKIYELKKKSIAWGYSWLNIAEEKTANRPGCAILSCSVVSDSLRPHGLQPTRFLCPRGFSRQEYWSGLPCLPPGGYPNPGIISRSPALPGDSLSTEPPGKSSGQVEKWILQLRTPYWVTLNISWGNYVGFLLKQSMWDCKPHYPMSVPRIEPRTWPQTILYSGINIWSNIFLFCDQAPQGLMFPIRTHFSTSKEHSAWTQ